MSPMDERKAAKEAREARENPVGERPGDVRRREEVVKERDARHLAEEGNRDTGAIGRPEHATGDTMRTGAERRMREGTPQAKEPDGRPYGEDWEPDSYGDKSGNVGGVGGKP